jgi:fucose permease
VSRSRILLSYAIFILIGISAGAPGVLLPAQIDDYGVDKATIGIMFITFSTGYAAGGALSGPILHRLAERATLGLGAGLFLAFSLVMATGPPFAALIALQVIGGFGTGLLDSALNTQIAPLPNSTTLLNRLHAFFGVGALIGPVLAGWQLDLGRPWTATWLTIAVLLVPLLASAVLLSPGRSPASAGESRGGEVAPNLLRTTLSHRAVWLAALFLLVYVGAEVSIGNWAPSLLVEDRGQDVLISSLVVSGYWLGLTVGRFTVSPLAIRLGYGPVAMIYGCLAGTALGALIAWVVPGPVGASVGLIMVGFFYGPLFPTTVAVMPQLTPAHLMPTAIGIVVAMAATGGALLPWVAGALADGTGIWSLLPYTLLTTGVMMAIWWRIATRLAPRPAPVGADR